MWCGINVPYLCHINHYIRVCVPINKQDNILLILLITDKITTTNDSNKVLYLSALLL
jgi:hypothetical protein